MSAIAQPVLGDDQIQNSAVIGWISRRIRKIRLAESEPFPLPPGMLEAERPLCYREWEELELEWGKRPNDTELIFHINDWIWRYLPPGNHAAGGERQKMLMTLRSVKAGRKRRSEGAVRFELDTAFSNRIATAASPLCQYLPAAEDEQSRRKNTAQAMFIRQALEVVLNDSSLTKRVNELATLRILDG